MLCLPRRLLCLVALLCLAGPAAAAEPASTGRTWTADNGNGTFTNPLFYDEFSDPDMIRVGDDYYLTGTTMHTMPGLPILHSRDLVNWRWVGYAVERLDLGPEFRLEGGEIYGQGIWAPSFRHHNGTFYIFTNINRHRTQIFRATDPAGPWTRSEMERSLHDLSVLFDGDKVYVVWGYNELRFAELKPDLTDIVPGTERVAIPAGSGMGEGAHFYKIDGRYYIIGANYDPQGYMVCARADRPEGPYEIRVISVRETLGVGTGWRLQDPWGRTPEIQPVPPRENHVGAIPKHQGGIVSTNSGEWWGFTMMDHNSIGRLTCLAPVTWVDGWPYFGLPGNLTRSPRTWVKPETGHQTAPHAPYQRSDDFSGPRLQPIWQWNHAPVDDKWQLDTQARALRLHTLPAHDFFTARNTLTQRAVGPESIVTVALDVSRLQEGDVAGLALLNFPYAWLGVQRGASGMVLRMHDQLRREDIDRPLQGSRLYLRAHCDFDEEMGHFSFSTDGRTFHPLGDPVRLIFQLKTFQGVRYSLFAYNTAGREGGAAEFRRFTVDEPRAGGLSRPIPHGRRISLVSRADNTRLVVWNGMLRPVAADSPFHSPQTGVFYVHDRGRGRVALSIEPDRGFVTVTGLGVAGEVRILPQDQGEASTFQWQDMLQGDLMLMSLHTNRYLLARPHDGSLASADSPGAEPNRKEGSCFWWDVVAE
jgi:xylan 1,4-beta-xylosidase